jgi:regulatory protein
VLNKKRLSKEEALQKLRHYCGYQERNHKEVKEKLYGFGLRKQDVEEAISILIEENYLNEERYANAYVGGYFRNKQWGRVKINYELKQKGISEYCIRNAMKEIDDEDYMRTMRELINKKREQLIDEELKPFQINNKILQYLLQRGFESQLVLRLLRESGSSD